MDAHHLALTSSDPSDIPPHNISLSEFDQHAVLAGIQGNMSFPLETPAAGKDPITRWYMNDGPWDPLTFGANDHGNPPIVSDMEGPQYVVPTRRPIVPSEFIPHSDSGYGSAGYHNRPSIANGSVCDDSFETSPDAQSVIGGSMVDAPFTVSDAVSNNVMTSDALARSWPNPGPIRIEGANMKCEICGRVVKTKSELKKHRQRHTKPFKCDVENCARKTEGFSTVNDLDRHKRSVHPKSHTTGTRYVCRHGTCGNKEKLWPRADNFKAHLKRVHQMVNVSDAELGLYIFNGQLSVDGTQESSRHDTAFDYNEFAGASAEPDNWSPSFDNMETSRHLNQVQGEDALSLPGSQRELADLRIPRNAPRNEIYQEAISPDRTLHTAVTPLPPPNHDQPSHESELNGLTSISTKEQAAGSRNSRPDATQVTGADAPHYDRPLIPLPIDSQAQNLAVHTVNSDTLSPDLNEPENGSTSAEPFMRLDFNAVDANTIKKLVDALQSHGLLEQHGYRRETQQQTEPTKAEVDARNNIIQYHCCSTCNKRFPRKCELKKHEKRHEKPYGCTSPGCDKTFGSKNDWKRHENTQHYMIETWRCDEKKNGSSSDICEKVCYRREHFKSHLSKEHQITDSSILETKLEMCRVGRNCEEQYWCGFCQKIVKIKQKDGQAWSERFDHIAEHFSGRNNQAPKVMSEWKNIDPSRPGKDSSRDDSDDESGSRSSAKTTKTRRGTRAGSHASVGQSKSKRKRDRDLSSATSTSKRSKIELQGTICCRCNDLITTTQIQCCNYGCEHIPCGDCRSTHKGSPR